MRRSGALPAALALIALLARPYLALDPQQPVSTESAADTGAAAMASQSDVASSLETAAAAAAAPAAAVPEPRRWDEGHWAIYLGAPEVTPPFPPTDLAAYWWWLLILYMFYVMAAVCDEYLVPAIDVICERFAIPEDVAGATLMAFACNGPETLTNVCAIFVTHSSLGMGTIVGSAVFNVMVIVGSCAIANDEGWLAIPKRTFLRDAGFSAISIGIVWWALPHIDMLRASVLFGMAGVYALVVAKSKDWFGTSEDNPLADKLLNVDRATDSTSDAESAKSPKRGEHSPGKLKRMRSTSHQGRHWQETTEAVMKSFSRRNSWPQHAESERAIWRNRKVSKQEAYGLGPTHRAELWAEYCALFPQSEGEKNYGILRKACNWCVWGVTFPTDFVLKWTIPDIKVEEQKRHYVLAFLLSMAWLTATSFVVCLGSDAIHKYWGIPQSFLGLTLVSIGTSFPNMWASVLTARQGRGPIAVSNALGSNVQNIFLVLAGPIWVYVVLNGTYTMGGSDIMSSIVWMGVSLSIVAFGIALNGWQLTARVGWVFCAIYVVYVVQTTLSE